MCYKTLITHYSPEVPIKYMQAWNCQTPFVLLNFTIYSHYVCHAHMLPTLSWITTYAVHPLINSNVTLLMT